MTNAPLQAKRMHLSQTNAAMLLGNIHANWWEVVGEVVSNSYDAGARNIRVVIHRDRISISDDGHGMIGFMPPNDLEQVESYLAWLQNHKVLPEGFNIVDKVSQHGRRSLQWALTMGAISWKKDAPRQSRNMNMRGMFGIGGTLGFIAIAEKQRITTRPDPTYGVFSDYIKRTWKGIPPAWIGEPPTPKAMRINDFAHSLKETTPEALKDAFGRELPHGTVVVISEIRPEVQSKLSPADLVRYLETQFGQAIAEEGLRIIVTDSVTQKGRAERSGIDTLVSPTQYAGTPLVVNDLTVNGTNEEFRVRIYLDHNPKKTSAGIRVIHLGRDMGSITTLAGFNTSPWNAVSLSGYIELPTSTPLTPDKKSPRESRQLNLWLEALEVVEQKLTLAIKTEKDKENNRKLQDLSDLATDAAQAAVRFLPDLRESLQGIGQPSSSRKNASKNVASSHAPQTRVIARAIDEHGIGVAGVEIKIEKPASRNKASGYEDSRTTQKSGAVSFGVCDKGVYEMSIITIPPGVKLNDELSCHFNLTKEEPGTTITFRFITGKKPKTAQLRQGLSVQFRSLPDPEKYWDSTYLTDTSTVIINLEGEHLRKALDANNMERTQQLVAVYVASALAVFAVQGTPEMVLQRACSLSAMMTDYMESVTPKRKKK